MAKAGATSVGRAGTGPWWDPFRAVWRLLTSVRFAFAITGFLAIVGFLGVVIPQIPIPMRGNPTAVDAWLALQEDRYGIFTEPMHRIGLFNVFDALWFKLSLGVLVVSVTVCTANRMPPTFRNVFRPPKRVPDTYFERARNRFDFALSGANADEVERQLRKRRYKVSQFREGAATYLFADRFPWSQLSTFISHLGLIVVLAGATVSVLLADETSVLIGEGTTRAVGDVGDGGLMQVRVFDAIEGRDEAGNIIDYRTEFAVFRQGQEVCRGFSTVNSPLSCEGYRFHQSFFDANGGQLTVRDTGSGNTLYNETIPFSETVPLPEIVVTAAGSDRELFRDFVPLTDIVEDAWLAPLSIDGRDFLVGVRPAGDEEWALVVFELSATGDAEDARLVIPEGESAVAGGLDFEFAFLGGAPAAFLDDAPGADRALLQMPVDREGNRHAVLVGLPGGPLRLSPEESVVVEGREYTFGGPRDFTGLTIRRDPGTRVIWFAGGMIMIGLVGTFYLPRRRLWAKIEGERVQLAGVAERTVNYPKEMRAIARATGANVAEPDDDR